MKELNINQVIRDFKGNAIGISASEPMTVRDTIMQQLGVYRTQDGKKVLEVYSLGMKVTNHKNDPLELEESEFNILKEVVNGNPAQMAVVAHAPILMAINQAENPLKSKGK